ncbi:thiol-disulfide oxidoreductase DCC family protein [Flavobacterium sp. Fl-77]|uniref:Thiol-disulfide oxidoreductase DCC family protein n=1 Tax=Flavobacterium flavipigmentatum TaxID=2893884 RepID=A0AAJ2SEE1_9FLAO|nr:MULTISPECIES: thiol-disulfide oxidoreductase DCC family protein [unclassified Flavobacterium]MDX6181501.1 thiol-disulfide oxidoreductase DCC family protein [Flavobacterium sp. Fl-33]MDX6185465.1 thiol-disulfide oxidoreductase DCC family protein [Flavobacterium sp. Fl-77]UFH37568.1 thiol-disulfide oxidoreductase DCC family protein [Flavobacterium sp. F-70]
MINFPQNKKIILFDGLCNLCNGAVQFIIKRDKKDVFRFVALQSELGIEICRYIGIDQQKIDSIVLYKPAVAYYYKSTAVLEIADELGGFYGLLAVFKIVPEKVRNYIYDYIAKNRYKWYGKKESCMIPTPELKAKFL